MQPNGLPTYSELELEIERLHRVISGGIDVASAHGMQILDLQRRIIEQNATIDRQAAQLEQYAKMLDDERATVAQLRAQLATVPVDCIRRYYAFTNYDALEANDAGYTTQQFDSDDMQIGMWLESLEDDA